MVVSNPEFSGELTGQFGAWWHTSMRSLSIHFSHFSYLATDELNPPPAPRGIDEISPVIVRPNVSGKSQNIGPIRVIKEFKILQWSLELKNEPGYFAFLGVGAGAQSVEGGITEDKVISMLVSQMDFSGRRLFIQDLAPDCRTPHTDFTPHFSLCSRLYAVYGCQRGNGLSFVHHSAYAVWFPDCERPFLFS